MKRGIGVWIGILFLLATWAGCGGGGSQGDPGAASVASASSEGPISGFGSVIMNGDRWRTETASIEVDGARGLQGDLAVGMVVRIEGDRGRDGTKRARLVRYAPRLRGPIRRIEVPSEDVRVLEIFGHRAIVSRSSTHLVDTTLSDLALDDLVEVSGLPNDEGDLEATFLRDRGEAIVGTSRVRSFGEVEGLAGGSFLLKSSEVLFDESTEIEDVGSDGLTDGDLVRVRGILLANDAIDAIAIKGREDDEDADEVEIQGIIRDYVSVSDFFVGEQAVDASGARLIPNDPALLQDGVRVEVEGTIGADDVLLADKLKFRSHRFRIHAEVADEADVNPEEGELVLLGVAIRVPEDARLRDRRDRVLGFSLDDVVAGDFLEVRGIARPDGSLIAAHVHRARPRDIRLQGPLDTLDGESFVVGLLGIEVPTSASTEFETEAGISLSREEFFDRARPGWKIQIRDREDGDESAIDEADSIEFDEPDLEDDDDDDSGDGDEDDDDSWDGDEDDDS